jgi:hypothetical protein
MTIKLDNESRIKNIGKLATDITSKYVESAIAKLVNSPSLPPSYEASTHYDLVYKQYRLPPKAVFGLALSELLGEQVKSSHFTGGLTSCCG